jgi:hypothetical protein
LFRDREGDPLVFSKPADKTQTPAFKANKVRELLGNYTVEMVFDDKKANLEEIAKLGIPGLYASLSDHVRHNPHQMKAVHGPKGVFVQTSDPEPDIEEAYRALPDPDDPDKKTVGDNMNPMGPLPNPGVKTNPAHPKKVEKAKKLYKHMNGKEPAKIEKKKVDLGDVWYQVGEGGCWQIGYISGKDDGREDQKYTHVFNEETKDGNYPKLYATMPENGKPMLIITGGTWKIKTDATGTAWIYD